MATLNKEYNRIKNILADKGFHLNGTHVFYGECPFSIHCGMMDNYAEIINNIDTFHIEYENHKNESLGKLAKRIK